MQDISCNYGPAQGSSCLPRCSWASCSVTALSGGESLAQLWVSFGRSSPKVQLMLFMLIL